jgi:hypothetical protein
MSEAPFDRLYFRREGGGNKAFYVRPGPVARQVTFTVVKYDFKETDLTFSHAVREGDRLEQVVVDVLGGRTPVQGMERQGAHATGSWVHIFGVTPLDQFVEITDRRLIDRLLPLEEVVEHHLRNDE